MKNINTETIIAMMTDYKEDDSILELIYDTVVSCSSYTDALVRHVMSSKTNATAPTRERAEQMTMLDRNRRICHESLISSIRALNRFLRAEEKEVFYPGDEESREDIGDFAVYVSEIVAKEEIGRARRELNK